MNRFAILLSLFFLVINNSYASDALHEPFDAVLHEHVIDGVVDYDGIARDGRFSAYLDTLRTTDPAGFATEEEKLAFWINAYNALAIKGIVEGLSPSSLFGRLRYFKLKKFDVAGTSMNLYDLERKVIIPFGEPRIHFAIVCASWSCPRLRSEAYIASRLDEQLDENTRIFINNPNKNVFDIDEKKAKVSKIFDWFKDDFAEHSGSVQKYIARYVSEKNVKKALENNEFKVDYLPYNWRLNGTWGG